MMIKKSTLFIACLLLAFTTASLPASAQDSPAPKKAAKDESTTSDELTAEQVVKSLDNFGQQSLMLYAQQRNSIAQGYDIITDKYAELAQKVVTDDIERFNTPHPQLDKMFDFYRILTAATALRQVVETSLHDLSYQVLTQYKTLDIPDKTVEKEPMENILYKGVINAYAGLYDLHVRLFCFPGTPNAPPDCGAWRQGSYFANRDNIIGMLLNTGTWYSDIGYDAMTLARAYFGAVPDKVSFSGLINDRGSFAEHQVQNARNSMQMVLLDRLASYKLPVSSETQKVMQEQLTMLSTLGLATKIDTATLCKDPPAGQLPKLTQYEDRICSWISQNNQISQSVIDQTLQHDIYLDPEFHNQAYNSAYGEDGPLDKVLVMMKAQKLAQQYDFLENFKMYVAVRAMRLNAPMQSTARK